MTLSPVLSAGHVNGHRCPEDLCRPPSYEARHTNAGMRRPFGVHIVLGPGYYDVSRITPQIYIGPQLYRVGMGRLKGIGIKNSGNMRLEFDDAHYGLAFENYLYIPTEDDHAPSINQLQQGVEFIQHAVDEGGSVYIHCGGGVGRAPTMAAAYFISRGIDLDDAIELIKRSRPIVHLTSDQVEQLTRYQRDRGNPC